MYQVWVKDEYTDNWTKEDCETLEEAKLEIMAALKEGKEPLLTRDVPYEISLSIHEGEKPPARTETKVETRDKPGAKKEKAVEPEKDTTQ